VTGDAALPALARRFEHFAERECTEDALYVALCRLLARRPAALALLQGADAKQQRPNLLLAALHARVLAGAAPALREYFASVGGERAPDAELAGALDAVLSAERDTLLQLVTSCSTQTNEIGRCAVLWPALIDIAARHAGRRIALLDFGCSAGLNLGVDHFAYDYGEFTLGATPAREVPRIECRLIGPLRPPRNAAAASIESRLGIDPAPVDVRDRAQADWLRACLWPGDRARAQRLEQALAIAQRQAWPLQRHADCAAAIEPWLGSLPAGVLPVVFNSWVLAYFERNALARHVGFMRDLVQRHHLVWLSAEQHTLALGDTLAAPAQGDARVTDDEVANGTVWWAVDSQGARALARSHPHGRWLQWLT
jgi:hypothetical protein